VRLHQGAVLDDLLVAGTIDAKFVDDHGHPPDPAMRRLWAHPEEEIQRWYGRSGYFPILHTVVVRDRVLVDHPQLARELYQLFEAAKTVALVKYEYGARLPERYHDISLRAGFPGATRDGVSRAYLGQDPIPYGLQPNREELERLIRYAHAQEAISAAPAVEDVFVDVGA
jgi:4,5-dihydroxyphthalate decarboxylase